MVMEQQDALSCCGSPTLTFSETCQLQWTINEEPFASFGHYNDCTRPCKKMVSGQMSLDSCVDVNATAVCPNGAGKVEETRISYLRKECSSHSDARARGHFASIVLVLVAVIIPGLVVKEMTS